MIDNNEYNEQIKMIESGFKNIQDCLCIKAQLNVDAIESAQDTIKNAQMQHEFEKIDKLSSLGDNIYQIKSQLSNVYDVVNDIIKQEDECKSDEILRGQIKEIMDMIKKNEGLNNDILDGNDDDALDGNDNDALDEDDDALK